MRSNFELRKKVAVDHDRCEKIQELSENVDKLKTLMKKNLGKFYNWSGQDQVNCGHFGRKWIWFAYWATESGERVRSSGPRGQF